MMKMIPLLTLKSILTEVDVEGLNLNAHSDEYTEEAEEIHKWIYTWVNTKFTVPGEKDLIFIVRNVFAELFRFDTEEVKTKEPKFALIAEKIIKADWE